MVSYAIRCPAYGRLVENNGFLVKSFAVVFGVLSSNEMAREEERVLDERKCIHAAAAGNRNAYGELVGKYQSVVYRVCLKMTGNPHMAEDLGQEVFIKAYDALPDFRFDASFSTWLYQITVRTCLDWRRSETRRQTHRHNLLHMSKQASHAESAEQVVLRAERSAQVTGLVNGLREPYRTVTKLYYDGNLSYQEIAEQTGASIKTVESQLYRARRMMRAKGDGLR